MYFSESAVFTVQCNQSANFLNQVEEKKSESEFGLETKVWVKRPDQANN